MTVHARPPSLDLKAEEARTPLGPAARPAPTHARRVDAWTFDVDGEAWPDLDPDRWLMAPPVRRTTSATPSERARWRVRAHAALRCLLAERLGVADPTRLCFRHGPFGKPHLDGGVPLSFSMTHSRNLVSVAMTHGADQYIGIDIEHDSPHIVEIALDVATPGERAALQTLTPPLRRAALLRLWVQKESLLKAEGSGFASAADQPNGSPLHTVELPVGTNTPMTPLRLPRSFPDVDSWSVHTFEPASNVAGAMAICAASSEIVWHGPLDVRGVLARF